jgi:hypothetical protein
LFPILLLFFILLIAALFIDSNNRIVTTEYQLFYANLPVSFDGFRIVVLSDIHAAEFGAGNGRLISKVEAAAPDIIAITGDFIDYSENLPAEKQLEIAETLVKGLVPIAPIYYVTGNHDWDKRIGGPWALIEMLEAHGVRVLRNQHTRLEIGDCSIILAGTDDSNGPADMVAPDEFVRRIISTEGQGFIVMLEHRNNNLPLYSELGVDLVLVGHSHGGIIRLPFTDGLLDQQRDWFPTHTSGVYTMGGTNMVVSRGLGNSMGLPRLLNNPHLVVAILRNSECGMRNAELIPNS